ncbi:MAG: helix-turn-helix transcriptional regulator [Ruminococcus sp.]|nr:helix-turn-helix transcriptional regulator [Ruminococcus sp.]
MSGSIGKRIKMLREQNHLTMEEFGERIGVQKSAVNKYEKGKVENMKRSTIEQICKSFNVSPQWLLGMEEPDMSITDGIVDMLGRLNKEGQEKVAEYVADLVASGRYSLKCSESEVV